MKHFGQFLMNIFLTSLLISMATIRFARAQDGMDDFFEDQYEDEGDVPYDPGADDFAEPLDTPDAIPRLPRPGSSFIPNNPMNSRIQNSTRFNSATDGEIVFKLVDPPKYWVPRKRNYRPPSDFR